MIMLPRKARPRRSANRVRLVNIDGSPVAAPAPDAALDWPAWTDNFFWEPGRDVHDIAGHVAPLPEPEPDAPDGEAGWVQLMVESSLPSARIPGFHPEPEDETDAEFFARLASEEAAERDRVLAAYQPLPEDMEEYRAYCEALDSGAIHPAEAGRFEFSPLPPPRVSCFTIEQWDAIWSGQVTEDELCQLAAHGAI